MPVNVRVLSHKDLPREARVAMNDLSGCVRSVTKNEFFGYSSKFPHSQGFSSKLRTRRSIQ
jgi:hypothetical protein